MDSAKNVDGVETTRGGEILHTVTIIVAFLFILGFKYVPPFEGLSPLSMEVLGIFIGAIILWLFISINWTSMVIIIALMFTPLYTASEVIAGSMGSWVVSFVMFTSALCYVLKQAGVFRRCAIWIITRKLVSKGPWHFISVLTAAMIFIGAFVSQLTVFLIFLPIVYEIFNELGYKKGEKVPALIMICILLFTTFTNFVTPIAHIMPIMGMALYTRFTDGLTIGFLEYSAVGIPLCIVLVVIVLVFLKITFKADFSKLENIDTDFLLKDYTPMSATEKIYVAVFAGVVFLWMAPGVLSGVLPEFAKFIESLGAQTPPMIGIVVLSLVRVKGEHIVNVGDMLSKGVSWSTFLIIAATAILGAAITHPDVGITDWIGSLIAPMLNKLPTIICVLLLMQVAIVLTNFASDSVTVTLLTSITIPMILSGALPGLNAAAMTYLIGQASCIGPATAVGGASAAISAGDGYLDSFTMFKWGMVLSIISGIILTIIGYPLANLIM